MLRLNPEAAQRIAQSVAAATAHLHSRGLLHGDVYAHNTLWDGEAGEAALSDFGATSILPAGEDKDAWCRIEVRAWGLLLGELLDHCTEPLENWERLRELESACVQEDVCARPLMADVINALSSA
jgi:serine/threonine protein kinase